MTQAKGSLYSEFETVSDVVFKWILDFFKIYKTPFLTTPTYLHMHK